MWRRMSPFLLVLAMVNVASADLLRPCRCGDEDARSCGMCPASKETAERPTAPAPC